VTCARKQREKSLMYDICLTVTAWCIIGLLGVLLIFSGEIVCADIGIRGEWHPAGLAQL
jgi:hypothetical protein